LGIGLSNPTSSIATVTLTARGYDGAIIVGTQVTNPVTLSISPGSQTAFLVEEKFGSGIQGQTGWVQVESNVAALKGLFTVFDFDLTFIDGSDLQTTPANRLIFPKVSSSSIFSFVNTGNSPNLVGISMFDKDGNLVARTTRNMGAYSGLQGSVSSLLPDVSGTEGYLAVETAGTPGDTLVGAETYQTQSDIAFLNAIPDTARARTGFIPHLIAFSGFVSRIALVNPTNQAQTVRLTADNVERNGQNFGPISADRTIPANGRIEEDTVMLFRLLGPALITGSVQWQTLGDTPGVIGYLDYGTADGILLSGVPAQSAGYSDLFFSHVANNSVFYTGLAFLNPNVQSTVIGIDVFDAGGRKTGSTVLTLGPGARISRLLEELIPGLKEQAGGFVRATASRPVIAFELFGSRAGLTFLANVSAQGVRPTPQMSGGTVDASKGAEVFSSDGSVSLLIPPGALSADTNISVKSIPASSLPDPSGTQKIVGVVQADPPTTFLIPVALTFPLAAQLDPGTEIPLLISRAGAYDPSEFTAVVDSSGRTATARVTHFSTYVVPFDSSRILTVTGLSSASGSVGRSVTIIGEGFSAAGGNVVTFAAPDHRTATATVTSITAASLIVTVPPTAISGDIVVRVGTQTSRGLHFDVTGFNPKPAIFSITPNEITQGASSAQVTIRGADFQSDSILTVDGKTVAMTFVDSTQLQVTLSGDQVSPAVHQIAVTNPVPVGGTSNTVEFTVGDAMPSITSLSPASSLPGSLDVTITGVGFVANSVVYVDGIAAPGRFVNGTTMQVSLSSSLATSKIITVFNPAPGGGSSNSSAFRFVATLAPTLTSIAPATGPINSAPTVTLTGTGFVSGSMRVDVSGVGVVASNFVVSSETSMTARFTIDPAAPLSAHDVTVTVANRGTSNPLTFAVVPPPPGISNLSVAGAKQGQTISETITGSNFVVGGTTVNVGGAGVLSNVVVQNSTTINLTLSIDDTATPGQYPITVATAGGTSSPSNFTVNPGTPTLTSMTPTSGILKTTIAVTLNGTHLNDPFASIAVGGTGVSAVIQVRQATLIAAVFTIAANATLGAHSVSVTTGGGTTASLTFTVNLGPPTLTSIFPSAGTIGTAPTVTLTGTNFVVGDTAVNISGTGVMASNVVVSNATTMTAKFTVDGAAAFASHNVSVTTAEGTSGEVAFNVAAAAPGVTGVNPQGAVQGQTVQMTITGSNFLVGGTSVSVGGVYNVPAVTVSNVVVANSTTINLTVAVAEEAPTGTYGIVVTTAGGTTVPIDFTITPAPAMLTSITPTSTTIGTSIIVSVVGKHFNSPTVSVSGTGVGAVVQQFSATEIIAMFTVAVDAAPGARSVSVRTAAGTSAPLPFTVNLPPIPTLTSVNPTSGVLGTSFTVTLAGTNFVPGATTVQVSGTLVTASNVVVVSSTSLTAKLTIDPAALPGDRLITVSTPGGTSRVVTFTVN
jgi:IPT/TIG domain/ZU5 domain